MRIAVKPPSGSLINFLWGILLITAPLMVFGGYLDARLEFISNKSFFSMYIIGAALYLTLFIFSILIKRVFFASFGSILIISSAFSAIKFLNMPLIYLELHEKEYAGKVVEGKSDFLVFRMHETSSAPEGTWEYMVFDRNDQIMLPKGERNKAWDKLHGGYLDLNTPQCLVQTQRLRDHFYYVLQTC